jgi:hypothetical protein
MCADGSRSTPPGLLRFAILFRFWIADASCWSGSSPPDSGWTGLSVAFLYLRDPFALFSLFTIGGSEYILFWFVLSFSWFEPESMFPTGILMPPWLSFL